MNRQFTHVLCMSFLLLALPRIAAGEPKTRCIELERQALLRFKRNLQHVNGEEQTLLSSWGTEYRKRECCKWVGLQCANTSGHVIALDLSPLTSMFASYTWSLRGNISSSLLELRHLNYLDLSHVNLSQARDWTQIVYQLPFLTSLLLPECNLPNIISRPPLSPINSSKSLSVLDLSLNNLSISAYDRWLFNFSRTLVDLDLSSNNLEGSNLEAFKSMSELESLRLRNSRLRGSIPEAFGNLSLVYLDLGYNMIEGEIPNSIWNICTLNTLDLSSNNISGHFPDFTQSWSMCSHHSLEFLHLSTNRVLGSIPDLTSFPSLRSLLLSSNNFNGTVSESLGQLSLLKVLDISRNTLKGSISEAHFLKLSNLSVLDLSFNPYLTVSISSDWVAPFELDEIRLGSCKLGPQFPKWLKTLPKNQFHLDISNSGISDSIPNWFWDLCANCISMNLSNNQISGTIKNSSTMFMDYPEVDLSSNILEGSIPPFLFKVAALDVSRNRFSSFDSMCHVEINGTQLSFLDVSYNQLFGVLPDCWSNFENLEILLLGNNKLSGEIPTSMGSLTRITTLHLGNNNLTAALPASLKNCKELIVLDVGGNSFSGPIPTWIGESTPSNLIILSLRSNHFYGNIPSHICNLLQLQLLDLSSNNLVGNIPRCFGNFNAMRESGRIETSIEHLYNSYQSSSTDGIVEPLGSLDDKVPGGLVEPLGSFDDKLLLIWKGILSEFNKTLGLVKIIDLSSNKLVGEIPREITELVGLVSLNLSRNDLSGQLPVEIGKLKSLDALDLSNNHLSGGIPSSLSQVDRLSLLDLSTNNLSGKIPTGTQLQSFDATAYMGNPELCGAPLPRKCPGEERAIFANTEVSTDQDDRDRIVTQGFYVSMAIGFVAGLWGVFVTLLINKNLRYSYIKFLNDARDWTLVRAALYKAKLLRMIES